MNFCSQAILRLNPFNTVLINDVSSVVTWLSRPVVVITASVIVTLFVLNRLWKGEKKNSFELRPFEVPLQTTPHTPHTWKKLARDVACPHEAAMNKAKAAGERVLIHKISTVDTALSILRDGVLMPHSRSCERRPKTPLLFLQLLSETRARQPHMTHLLKEIGDAEMITLVFSLDLLKRDDYHISVGWQHGSFVEGHSFKPEQMDDFLTAMPIDDRAKNNPNLDPIAANEVVFSSAIDFSHLQKIVVHSNIKAELMRKLEQIPVPEGHTSWDELVAVSNKEIPLQDRDN